MGRDKARVELTDDTTLLEAIVDTLSPRFERFTAVADRPGKYDDLGIPTIADPRPHQGPLGGILRAVEDTQKTYLFVTSCDRAGLQAQWIERLEEKLEEQPPAVTFVHDGRREPLFGFYRNDLGDRIRAALTRGDRAVWRFLDAIAAATVEAPAGWSDTIAVNTPEDLKRARQL